MISNGSHRMVTVIIPVLNESSSVRYVVEFALQSPGVSEVIVVDDGSIDGTPELALNAGARVITSTLLGKGASMADGIWAATNEQVVFLDGDLSMLTPDLIARMVQPLENRTADFVKARFTRSSGRVTVLTARPLLQTFFPELNHIDQPLGGIISGTRSLFRNLRLETDYGVDVGLLIDVNFSGARIGQVDVGEVQHDSQRLEALGDMARQVSRTIINLAARYNRLSLQQVQEVEETERASQLELTNLSIQIGQPARLALFDMDGTLVGGRFVESLARRVNRATALSEYLDNSDMSASERMEKIASLFAGVPRQVFEEVAAQLPLMSGAREAITWLRAHGFRVGIISDSYFVATEIVRRRLFGDFSIAHLMKFRDGVATGAVLPGPAMLHSNGCHEHSVCKFNAVMHLIYSLGIPAERILSVGDGTPDCCMFRGSGISFAFNPRNTQVAESASFVIHDDLSRLVELLPGTTFMRPAVQQAENRCA